MQKLEILLACWAGGGTSRQNHKLILAQTISPGFWHPTPPPASTASQGSRREKLQVISWLLLRSMELAENFHGVAGPLLTPSPHLQNSQYFVYSIWCWASEIRYFSTFALTSSGASLLTSGFFSGAFIFHTTRGGVSCCTWRIQGGGDGWDDVISRGLLVRWCYISKIPAGMMLYPKDSSVKIANRLLFLQQQM